MMDKKRINIAIDGFSACGKSTMAQALAALLHFDYVDTGAMYRAITLFGIRKNILKEPFERIIPMLPDIHIKCAWTNNKNRTYLNDEDVSEAIRQPSVQNLVSQFSTIPAVRRQLVFLQQQMAKGGGVVMDGRDIGSVVLPEAELKIFMTARVDVRVQRRVRELLNKGIEIDAKAIEENLKMRDHIDSTREDSPLIQAKDARVLDNSDLSPDQQLNLALSWVNATIQ